MMQFKKMQIGLAITQDTCVIVNNNCDPIILNPTDLLTLSLSLFPSIFLPSLLFTLATRQSGDKFKRHSGSPI